MESIMPQLSDFNEVRFPVDIAFGSSGGPERSTEIVTLGSGREKRNQRWMQSRRRYEAGYGVKDLDALQEVVAFYEAQRGPLIGFRFRDPLDWKSCAAGQTISADDQVLGEGDGTTTQFRLRKSYGHGQEAYSREIVKPHSGSVRIAVDGVALEIGTQIMVDDTTGLVDFQPDIVPAPGTLVTAGYAFDVPVRFASDQFTVNIAAFQAGDVPSIPLVEIRL